MSRRSAACHFVVCVCCVARHSVSVPYSRQLFLVEMKSGFYFEFVRSQTNASAQSMRSFLSTSGKFECERNRNSIYRLSVFASYSICMCLSPISHLSFYINRHTHTRAPRTLATSDETSATQCALTLTSVATGYCSSSPMLSMSCAKKRVNR